MIRRPPRSTRTSRGAWSTTCIASSTLGRGARARGGRRAEMARAGHAYPQVEPGAIVLMDGRVVACAPRTRVARALERARAAGARVVLTGPRQAVRTAELARAVDWGLGARPVRGMAWRELPALPADASEIEVRRRLRAGGPPGGPPRARGGARGGGAGGRAPLRPPTPPPRRHPAGAGPPP